MRVEHFSYMTRTRHVPKTATRPNPTEEAEWVPLEVGTDASSKKTRIMGILDCQNSFKIGYHLNTTAACDGQTHTQTHIHVMSVSLSD